MRSCLGVVDRDLRDPLCAILLVDSAVLVEDTTVTMGGVLAQADVARQEERGEEIREKLESEDNGRLGRRSVGSGNVLERSTDERIRKSVQGPGCGRLKQEDGPWAACAALQTE